MLLELFYACVGNGENPAVLKYESTDEKGVRQKDWNQSISVGSRLHGHCRYRQQIRQKKGADSFRGAKAHGATTAPVNSLQASAGMVRKS